MQMLPVNTSYPKVLNFGKNFISSPYFLHTNVSTRILSQIMP
jgi:hypothetical protein